MYENAATKTCRESSYSPYEVNEAVSHFLAVTDSFDEYEVMFLVYLMYSIIVT